jgi:DNA helicase-2/ATP-dependent DNA helicase PcrA
MLQYAENAEVFKLTNNYRSASGIVDAANRMIVKNTRRIEKSMIPAKRDPGTVRLVLNADTDLAVSLIRELTRNGVTPVSTAVLSRTHVLLARLSQELTAAGIMHTYCGRDNKLMNSEVFRRLHAISKLALNKYDNFSFALCRQIIGCSDAEYGEVITAAISGTRELTHLDIYLDMIEGSVHDRAEWCAFFEVGHRHDMETYHRILTNLVKRSMVLTDQDIDRGLSLLRSWRGTTLQGYLDWVTTYDLQEEVEPHQPGLQLMTVHAAKGLEFDQVLLLGWNEGILPGQHAIDAGDIEEERRIGYVATTRAIQTLVVTARPINKQARNGRVYEQPVSRFMYELQGVWKE